MKAVLCVALGGCLGAILRWGVAYWVDTLRPSTLHFPLGILTANVSGCFLFGLLFGIGETRDWMTPNLRLALFTGFLGSFTTFSTFSWNTFQLFKNGEGLSALTNILCSLILSIVGVWAGYMLATANR